MWMRKNSMQEDGLSVTLDTGYDFDFSVPHVVSQSAKVAVVFSRTCLPQTFDAFVLPFRILICMCENYAKTHKSITMKMG